MADNENPNENPDVAASNQEEQTENWKDNDISQPDLTQDYVAEQGPPAEDTPEDRKLAMEESLNNPVNLVEWVYLIWWLRADFHLYIISPHVDLISPPIVIKPEMIPGSSEYESVYPIHDYGSILSTSKGEEMFSAGMSMRKLYYTIEKMVAILVDRLKAGGTDMETEVQVAFGGHQLAWRKAFESIINLSYNVVVTNFDPGEWGERYLQIVKRISDMGYGFPPESPRDVYKQLHTGSGAKPSR